MGKRVRQHLTVKGAQAFTKPGMYCDGGGLYLRIGRQSGKSWILRTTVFGQRRDLGLGSFNLVTLAEAREEALKLRKIARSGGDPDSFRRRETLTFEKAATRAFGALKPTWSSEKHAELWWSSLERYVFPKLGAKPIDLIVVQDIHRLLLPIWSEKYETAKRIKQRIQHVFEWAKGAGHLHKENPVNGLSKVLLPPKGPKKHHAALPWAELPNFMEKLSRREGVSARLLEFLILTCSRSNEARGARWDEIDDHIWTVPPERMKARQEHRVPLSAPIDRILAGVAGLDDELIFPSIGKAKNGSSKKTSDQVFAALMKRMGVTGITTHGFRSTFRDWCRDNDMADRELAELVLAHKVGSAVERAYARSDLLERRTQLMDQWAEFALSKVKVFKVKKRPKKRITRVSKYTKSTSARPHN
ncbi:tyrosine-type recombinase/integrase [Loktanella agnita]|uniref:tyrosine-type recombinase/integrase n=1 Tax=Loktanella agnita TaxID=287097 RepID=UPI003986AFC0